MKTLFKLGLVSIILLSSVQEVRAAVQPVGRLYYGNGTNTVLNFRTNTYNFGFGGAQTYTHGASASLIRFVVAKAAPTRDEVMVGIEKADGELTVIKGINGFDVNTDYSTAWSNAGTGPAMTCEGTKVACTRAFDITYERLSGRAMVVYADDVNQKLYYCYWDGSSWGPVSNCAPTNGQNDIDLTSNGLPTYIQLKPKGGSNEILMGVGVAVSGVMEVEAFRWTGSAWTDHVLATDTTDATVQPLIEGNAFDVEWESLSGDALVIFATTAATEVHYKLLPSGSGSWGSEQNGFNTPVNGSSIIWINVEADPQSDRLAAATNDSANDFSTAVWKGDGSTAGWSVMTTDTSLEGAAGTAAGPAYTDVNWEQFGSAYVAVAQNSGAGDSSEYARVTCNGSGCSLATAVTTITTTAATDDQQFIRLAAARNSNDLMMISTDIDRNLYLQHWDGSAWNSGDSGVLDASMSVCSADNVTTGCAAMPAVFMYLRYSPWSRNWRWYDGTDTTDTPTTALAAENATSTDIDGSSQKLRLRFNVVETGGQGETDSRKKLQYTTTNPLDETTAAWTDVDNAGGSGIWRYVDCNGGSSVCDDGQTISSTVLTGSTDAGWWNGSSDAAPAASMDHATSTISEIEFPIEANGAASDTTYYFRMYDVDQDMPIRRFQDVGNGTSCAGSKACEYPELKTAAVSAPTVTTNFASPGSDSAIMFGTMTSGNSASQHGFAYGTDATLKTVTATTSDGSLAENDTFSRYISGLSITTVYYFRAYVTNGGGTSLGIIRSFTTGDASITRKIRLFGGFIIKFLSGKIKLL